MRYSHEHKFVYIVTPKTASGAIRHALDPYVDNKGDTTSEDHLPAWKCKQYFDEQGWNWNEYFKFTFVRHPADMLISMYMYEKKELQQIYDMKIKQPADKIRMEHLERLHAPDMTFDKWLYEFLPLDMTPHEWVTGENLKEPCINVNSTWTYNPTSKVPILDYVGKYERLEEDFNIIREKIGLPSDVELQKMNTTKHDSWETYYDSISLCIVKKYFAFDLKAFDYHLPEIEDESKARDEVDSKLLSTFQDITESNPRVAKMKRFEQHVIDMPDVWSYDKTQIDSSSDTVRVSPVANPFEFIYGLHEIKNHFEKEHEYLKWSDVDTPKGDPTIREDRLRRRAAANAWSNLCRLYDIWPRAWSLASDGLETEDAPIIEAREETIPIDQLKLPSEYNYENITLITQIYKETDQQRLSELRLSIKNNIRNKHITNVVLFIELNEKTKSANELIKLYKLDNMHDQFKNKIKYVHSRTRLSYKLAIDYVLKQPPGPEDWNTGYLLCNNDCYFDDTVEHLKYVKLFDQRLLCMTRYDQRPSGEVVPARWDGQLDPDDYEKLDDDDFYNTMPMITPLSNDAWFFSKQTFEDKLDNINTNYTLGTVHCEGNFIYNCHNGGLRVFNVGIQGYVKCIHLHNTYLRKDDDWDFEMEARIQWPQRDITNYINGCWRPRCTENPYDSKWHVNHRYSDFFVRDFSILY